MKRTVYLFLALCLLASCKQAPKPTEQKRPLTKLEQLYRLPPDSAIFSYDLSNCGISEFPDLSRYTIKSLNLPGNRLNTIVADHLPHGIHTLDVSRNAIADFPDLSHCSIARLDLSGNQLTELVADYLPQGIYYLNAGGNKLTKFPDLSRDTIEELYLSKNLLDTVVWDFLPQRIRELNMEGNPLKEFDKYPEDPKAMRKREKAGKVERLYQLHPGSKLSYYDLSADHITDFPDLSRYAIDSLNLSHNQLRRIVTEYLPKGIKWLDVSHNRLGDTFLYQDLLSNASLRKVNLSHNRINRVATSLWSVWHVSRKDFRNLVFMRSISEDMSASWAMFLLPADSLLEYPECLEKFRDEGMVFAEGLSIP